MPSAKHITALKQVSADFPYFIHAKVLLAKALYQENHYEYDKFLKQAALVVPDREVLYHYLHYGQTALQAVMPNIAEEVKAVLPPLVVTESIETPPSHQEQVILQDIPVVEALPVSQIEEDSTLPSLIEAQLEKQEPTLVATTEPLVPHTELMVTSIEMEEEPQEIIEQAIILEAENVTPGLEVDIDASTGIEEQHPSSPETPALPLELTTVEAVETKLVAEPNESHSFMEWLNLAQGKKPVVKEPETTLEQPVNDLPTEPVKPVIEVTREDIERAVAKSNVNDFQNILDKFIKENPSISRPKAEFFNPVNMAKQSVEEDEELVTETLANLYYKQGNHKRAIRAYEKLCLIYPSKMTYFASLIQKIKSEIKD